MSKELTHHGSKLAWLIVSLAVITLMLILGLMFDTANAQSPTPEPAPRLTFSKTGMVDGNRIEWEIAITNSGNADSSSQTVQDTLPAGVEWSIVPGSDSFGCTITLSTISDRQRLECGPAIVIRRHLNETEDDFVNGRVGVRVSGIAETCGNYVNFATRNVIDIRVAAVSIACPATPTPQPSPTVIPATNTPTPGVTTTPTQTTSPSVAPSSTPKPPNTGNSTPLGAPDHDIFYILVITLLVVGCFGMYYCWRAGHDK